VKKIFDVTLNEFGGSFVWREEGSVIYPEREET
jgi:hypothetical protein